MHDLPPPYILGLPPRYETWRNGQDEAAVVAYSAGTRFVSLACPTGFGKSLAYMGAAKLAGRTIILTSTKGLQTQLITDFRESGLEDVRGMGSYLCLEADRFGLPGRTTCNEGPCQAGAKCKIKDGGCLYYDAYRRALSSPLVVTNYSYFLHINRYGEGLGRFDMLVLDEAHSAAAELSNFVGVLLDPGNLGALLDDGRTPDAQAGMAIWRTWGQERYWKADYIIKDLQLRIAESAERGRPVPLSVVKRATKLKYLMRQLEAIATMEGEWAIERQKRNVRFDPVWPAPYAERYLFKGIPKVVLFSATIRPKTAQLLGISRDQLTFKEYPSTFPVANRKVYHVPTVSVKHGIEDIDIRSWVTRIDQIIGARLDRKGIIHVTSYARRDLLLRNSEYRRVMQHHSAENTAQVVEKFRRSPAPAVLVSPSVTTGWDFPYDQCEYQIIAKVPFPDFTSELAKARDASDPEWSKYETMQTLVQTTGRGCRAEDDVCETLIVDDNIEWFVRRYRHFAPKWWLDSFEQVRTIPTPSKKLQKGEEQP